MRRREFIALVSGTVAALPFPGRTQPHVKVPRVGFLTTEPLGSQRGSIEAFRQGLNDRGYVEGGNIIVEYRTADGMVDRFRDLAIELIQLKVDLIVATNSLAARAVQQATKTIPIVVPVMGDPVEDGLVVSLSGPGGNTTGFTFLGPELLPKRLALLKEAIPTVSDVAALWHPGAYGERTMNDMMSAAETEAHRLSVNERLVAVHRPEELERAFSMIGQEHADAILIFPSPMFFTARKRIAELASRFRIPAMAMDRDFVTLGVLMAYGASIADLIRRCTIYMDKLLKGAKPSDLPVEQPTKFELVINLTTAKSLGTTIPPTLFARADEVIE
jgi:ABC-type uncharacterized transport system substrate-binding protein